MEPVDVKNKEYVVFDSQGRLLEALVSGIGKGRERVVLRSSDQAPKHQSELRDTLINYLSETGELKAKLEACRLDELVKKGLRFQR